MGIVRHYVMIAKDGQEQALRDALQALAAKVRPLDGCTGVDLYLDAEKEGRFTFLEHWQSLDAYKAGGRLLGKEALSAVMAALGAPPEAGLLTPIAPA